MKRSSIAIAVAAAMVLTAGSALAQKGQGGPKGPKTKVTQPTPKGTGGGAPKLHANAAQGPKAKSTTPKTHGPKSAKATTHGKPAKAPAASAGKTKGAEGGRKSTTTTAPAATSLTLSPVQQKLQKNTNLASKLEGRLPGTDVIAAADGFRNLGQFVAAVNVSNNLNIPFADLKTRMVVDGMSLGQAIQAERNDVDVTTVVRRAEQEAQVIIADSDEATKKKVVKPAKAKKRDGQ